MIITTAIDYPNSLPHIGTAYEKVLADIQCRGMKLFHATPRLLMGVDENTTKVELQATEFKVSPQEYADEMARQFQECWKLLGINYDIFVRTSSKEHRSLVEEFIAQVRQHSPGAIYWGEYESPYCDGCEEHKTYAKLTDGKCPSHPKIEIRMFKEQCWMFRLTQFKDQVAALLSEEPQWIDNRVHVVPETKRREAVALLEEAHDTCISREIEEGSQWGIPFPRDNSAPETWLVNHQRIYVWFDALLSYLHAGESPYLQHIGKDINRFHTNLWPAMLLAANRPRPKRIMVHGFILSDGNKASKSSGSEPIKDLIAQYGVDAIRYFYASACRPENDSNFTHDAIKNAYNDLANKLGNLASRVATLIQKLFPDGMPLQGFNEDLWKDRHEITLAYNRSDPASVCDKVRAWCNTANELMEREKPWQASSREDKHEATLGQAFIILARCSYYLLPILPSLENKVKDTFGDIYKVMPNTLRIYKVYPWFPRMK